MEQKAKTDTIAAIATPVGQGGIGIVRLSGPDSLAILRRIFRPKNPKATLKTHRLYLGHIFDPGSGLSVDEVLVTHMQAPNTYTREDVVEINSHSGYMVLSKILDLVLGSGARLARPGEFTFRAYLNGRIDLTQAEAVAELISSRSERGLYLASQQIGGALRDKINSLRHQLIQFLGHVEAAIDFPDEEDTFFDKNLVLKGLRENILPQISELIEAHSEKKIWIQGISTVIAGRVNVGKSSLLNRLLDEQRAIVTPVPGTTRDVVESNMSIEGLPIRLMDTAGIRKEVDEIEKIGIQLTKQKLNQADLVLAVLDQSIPISPEDKDLLNSVKDKTTLLVVNKIDLPPAMEWDKVLKGLPQFPTVKVSALTGKGIRQLKKEILRLVVGPDIGVSPSAIAPNLRQAKALEQASQYIENALSCVSQEAPLEIVALELKSALDTLGEIIGETTPDDVLETIFSTFCIGK
ncbi:MAG: tRNA uridine-5-carboxymethylaminomethyl(34) synthesis GTPase MnmE [Deltaproteobacteria bacterium]|nr:tRNA uridine-5-carboxymethylaminomethyl(34) synthesis GTPase MnmE [Deltaproteobacteria bacterium]MBW2083384.1 tRNA uridine-5-carboxymethylaminomethyl(34) synthesis GTPase MnmE [Deltaproteobacteria bacterium]